MSQEGSWGLFQGRQALCKFPTCAMSRGAPRHVLTVLKGKGLSIFLGIFMAFRSQGYV